MRKVSRPQTFGIWLPAEGWGYDGIGISNLSDDHRQLVVLEDVMVPRSFTARVERDDLPLVELDIELLDQRFRCVQLRVLRRNDSDFVEAQQLRQISLVELIREAAGLVAYIVFELRDEDDVERVRDAFRRIADLDSTPVRLEEIRVGDFFRVPALLPLLDEDNEGYKAFAWIASERLAKSHQLLRKATPTHEDVARVYRQAIANRRPVTDAVADEFGWRQQTARNRIHAARKAGLLGETVRGRAQS